MKSPSSKSTFIPKRAEQRGLVRESPLISNDRLSLFLGKHRKKLSCKNYSTNVNVLRKWFFLAESRILSHCIRRWRQRMQSLVYLLIFLIWGDQGRYIPQRYGVGTKNAKSTFVKRIEGAMSARLCGRKHGRCYETIKTGSFLWIFLLSKIISPP